MATSIQPGTIIEGKYRVLERIGEGGMGTVFEGENIRIERRVAIKVLHEHVAGDPEFSQRFEREARASARIGSNHVCDVLDLGDLPNGERFIVMEFLEGESLEDRIAKGALTAEQLAPIAFEILEGLGTMHSAGVIHRDLKPANVFLAKTRAGRGEIVKILDFGVAKIIPKVDDPDQMTSTGMMMGTPLYMSPEQARGARDVDGRTDLYAASVIFYRALTGQMPHSGLNLHELLFKIVLEDPTPIKELVPTVDDAFAEIITRGLCRDADQRYSSAREFQKEIAEWGEKQNRATLRFTVTLPDEPPPLRNITGGYSVSKIRAQGPSTGPNQKADDSGALPAVAKTLDPAAAAAAASPPTKQSGGTPIVWSEDAPEIAKRAMAELEARNAKDAAAALAAVGGKTQVITDGAPVPTATEVVATAGETDDVAGPAVAKSSKASTSSKAPPKAAGIPKIAFALGGVVIIGAAALGVRFAKPAPVQGSSANAVMAEPSATPPPPTTPIAAPATPTTDEAAPVPTPTPSATPTSNAVAAPTPKAATPSIAPTSKTSPTASGSAAPKPTVAPPPTQTAAPTPSATSSARKFRKSLD